MLKQSVAVCDEMLQYVNVLCWPNSSLRLSGLDTDVLARQLVCAQSAGRLPHEMLFSLIMTRRQNKISVLKAFLANISLASFCLAVTMGTILGLKCQRPSCLRERVMVLTPTFTAERVMLDQPK